MAISARLREACRAGMVSFYPVSKKFLALASSPNPNAAREITLERR